MERLCLNGSNLKLSDFSKVMKSQIQVDICPRRLEKLKKTQEFVQAAKNKNIPVYGLTRDVGQFKNETLNNERKYDKEVLAMHSTVLGYSGQHYYSKEICKGK